jgi:PAS domain S-box-containing protein
MTVAPGRTLSQALLTNMLLVATLSCVLIGCLWVAQETLRFKDDMRAMREQLIGARKETMRQQVDGAAAYLEFMRGQTEARTRRILKERVDEAHQLATHLYNQYRASKSEQELVELIREALRPIRFNSGRGYYFATRLDGIEQLCATCRHLEGQNLLDLRDTKGVPVIRNMIDLARGPGEGFISYTWSKPDAPGTDHIKISFIKLFEPLGWFIGTGEYLQDIEKDLQREALHWIRDIRYEQDGYVFAGRWDGVSLSGPGMGQNLSELTDVNGVKIVQEMIRLARGAGGFVSYVMPRFEGHRPLPKISYTRGVPAWQWYIGTGLYIDDIENDLADHRRQAVAALRWNIAKICLTLVVLWLGVFALVTRMNRRLQTMYAAFARFFDRGAHHGTEIALEGLAFEEFRELGRSANRMISQRREAERSLHQSRHFLETLIENSGALIFVKDSQGTYTLVNQAFEAATGLQRPAILGKTDAELFPADAETLRNNDLEVLRSKTVLNTEEQVHTVEGIKHFLSIKFPLFDSRGEVSGVCGMITEITDRKQVEAEKERLQAQLVQWQKMESIGRLAGGVAHDFNNMLSVILGHAEIAMEHIEPDQPLYARLVHIREAARRSADLTRQLLAFARKQTVVLHVLDLNDTVAGLLNMIRRLIREGIELVWQPGTETHLVTMDPSQIDQILVNLCVNASDAIGDTGTITIKTCAVTFDQASCTEYPGATPGDYVRLSVSDTGCGMDQETKALLFEPFFTTKEVGKGTGLGLATVYGIVQQNNGFLTVDSEPGQGTTFNIFLPRSAGAPETLNEEGLSPPASGRETILLVEDEPMILEMTVAMLQSLGYTVLSATTPDEALGLARAQTGAIDLLVTDVVMPAMNGSELAASLQSLRPTLKLLFMSGYTADVIAHHGVLAPGVHFLQKPFTRQELAAKVWEALHAEDDPLARK